tara:strand:- start:2008 stop:2961 length:954 start_codon:yes stop_codon:yes gene_type:complete
MKVCIIGFNIGRSKGFVNGPGTSLFNFVKFLNRYQKCNVSVYTQLPSLEALSGVPIRTIYDTNSIKKDILESDIVHCWSGMTKEVFDILLIARKNNKKIFLGPNLIDTVHLSKEAHFISEILPKKLFVVNNKIKKSVVKKHKLNAEMIKEVVVGPDLEIWSPPDVYSDVVLWKGNSRHMVKDIGFGLEVSKRLGKYNFLFLGHPKPYDYNSHIGIARSSYVYFTTSISETKGMALLEQMAAGVPSVTHSKIYQNGVNYKTGIIAERTVDAYCKAIEEIVEDKELRESMSKYSSDYVKSNFDPEDLAKQAVRYYLEED